ncbi:uncharacterized protein RJT21DRAFT_119401 [Scheffersomyces amazonensis]|uniref:uncharacterized protein n=1 Tax=Scheffersomyces amazonensis TaxID=1078765 RepID=UPI00315CE51D
MIRRREIIPNVFITTKRYISNESSKKGAKRFMQTIPITGSGKSLNNGFYSGLIGTGEKSTSEAGSNILSKWSSHKLTFPVEEKTSTTQPPLRRSRNSRFAAKTLTTNEIDNGVIEIESPKAMSAPISQPVNTDTSAAAIPTITTTTTTTPPKKRRTLRPRKALITLTPSATEHLTALLNQPNPKLIRIGVRNRGCSGLTYHLEYVDEPGKFDETIEQDGVKVLIDSKALFSIVGSEMDWLDDKLSSRFIFKNPNSKGTCGCGESFMV